MLWIIGWRCEVDGVRRYGELFDHLFLKIGDDKMSDMRSVWILEGSANELMNRFDMAKVWVEENKD